MRDLARKARVMKSTNRRRIALGLCVTCRNPRDGKSLWRCKDCLKKMAQKQQKINNRRKKNGFCIQS